MCDHVFTPPLDGFGISGLQIYFKHGLCITWIHDEILWMCALNLMLKHSVGAALWIGIGMNDIKQRMSIMEIDEWFTRRPDIMAVGELLDTLIKSNARLEYVIQRPGQLVASPPSSGAAHIVIADGLFITQLAWNLSFNAINIDSCLGYWGEVQSNRLFGHISADNGSQASYLVVPLFTMAQAGYPTTLADRITLYRQQAQQLQDKKIKCNLKLLTHKDKTLPSCGECGYRQDWATVEHNIKSVKTKCVHCFFTHKDIIKLLQ